MGSLWSSTPLMTASRLPWMNCGAANSPTKSYWTPRSSSWDWGHTSHGEAHDSVREPAGPEAQKPITATTAAPDAGFNHRCPAYFPVHCPTSAYQRWANVAEAPPRYLGSAVERQDLMQNRACPAVLPSYMRHADRRDLHGQHGLPRCRGSRHERRLAPLGDSRQGR